MKCFSSGSEEEKERAWTDIGTEELKEMLGNKDIQLIDVREQEELLDLGRIPSSINIPCMYDICRGVKHWEYLYPQGEIFNLGLDPLNKHH